MIKERLINLFKFIAVMKDPIDLLSMTSQIRSGLLYQHSMSISKY